MLASQEHLRSEDGGNRDEIAQMDVWAYKEGYD